LNPTFLEMIQVRIEPSSVFSDVMGVMNSNAWLGSLIGPRTLSLEFRIELTTELPSGEYAIPIGFCYGPIPAGSPQTLSEPMRSIFRYGARTSTTLLSGILPVVGLLTGSVDLDVVRPNTSTLLLAILLPLVN
jgi:hypothetical protein